jgi:hypothetical protein
MSKERLFLERRSEGDYAVREHNSERPSLIAATQVGLSHTLVL